MSEIFKKKGKLSRSMLRNLMVRGGGVQVDDTLQRFGWAGEEPAVTTVLSIDGQSGAIRGARYEARGRGPTIQFRASELWTGGSDKIMVKLKFDDLSRVSWPAQGDSRNQSEWIGEDEVSLESVHDEEGIIGEGDRGDHGIGGFCVRFTLLPVKVDTVFLYGGVVPFSKTDLETKMSELDVGLDSPMVPTLTMKLGLVNGRYQNALPLSLVPQEQDDDNLGLGHLPLLEAVGSGNPIFPDHDMIAGEMSSLLRATNPTNNVNPGRMRSIFEGSEALAKVPTGKVVYEWPEMETSTGRARSSSMATPTGMTLNSTEYECVFFLCE